MKFGILLSFIFLLSACGSDICEGSDFFTKQGICVFTNGFNINRDYIELTIDISQQKTTEKFPKKYSKENIEKGYNQTSITIIEFFKEKDRLGETECNSGRFIHDTTKVKVQFKNCATYLILAHEMLHVFRNTMGELEPHHPKGWFIGYDYTEEENISSLESNIQFILYNKLCNIEL